MSSVAPTASESGPRAAVPPFTAAHEELRGEMRAFVTQRLRPHADEWEAAGWFPNEVFGWLAQAGYLGLKFPREYGGADDTAVAAALAITEPDAGSDVASLRTRARQVDGGWVVNGAKTYITGGVRADVLVCAVAVKPRGGHQDFQWERLLMALGAVGAMQACFELTRDAVLAGGRQGQATRHALAHVATEIEAGRAVTYAALRRHVAGQDAVREVTIAKLRTQRAAVDAIDACLQVLGLDAPPELERALRDARLGPIGGGTDEIMKEILGRSLGL